MCYLKIDGSFNVLVVCVDYLCQIDLCYFIGFGIYCNVWLSFIDLLYIVFWGIFVMMFIVSVVRVEVKVEVEFVNVVISECQFMLCIELIVVNGQVVVMCDMLVWFCVGECCMLVQGFVVDKFWCWLLEIFQFYQLCQIVLVDGKFVDQIIIFFGICSFCFDVDIGFMLNGQVVKFKGVCLYYDVGSLGVVVLVLVLECWLWQLKDIGVNVICISYNLLVFELFDFVN